MRLGRRDKRRYFAKTRLIQRHSLIKRFAPIVEFAKPWNVGRDCINDDNDTLSANANIALCHHFSTSPAFPALTVITGYYNVIAPEIPWIVKCDYVTD